MYGVKAGKVCQVLVNAPALGFAGAAVRVGSFPSNSP